MVIFINDEKHEMESSLSLSELLLQFSITQLQGIAVAINNKVVQKNKWDTTVLSHQDRILIIKATKGG